MVRSRSQPVFTRAFDGDLGGRQPDELIVEEPLRVDLDGHVVSSTMRTPGHDFELAAGFLLSEGMLGPGDIVGIRYCGTGSPIDSEFNAVTVETGGRVPEPTARLGSISSSCGICGTEAIETLTERLRVLPAYEPWDLATLAAAPDRLRSSQPLFDTTGSVHAAAAIDRNGDPLVIREDIGRHNAVDKVVGRLLLDGRLPAHELALVVSGRASFEMVQKAWAGGFTALVSVSGPSALAVATARRAGLTVMGFTRGGNATLYSPAELV
ncbi:MAG: formate dehydrogenase accessory sulfurtransferase FdhD [Acidimicrobiia bacterium]|nr:formate dehydrogenase accessory sulfurtransferase FdhD [Acidimicrobiia bacterium]MDH5519083.1 formate dehydrogenase accessory sulfurtransferase FdhD [Acidimicrobiia bacterium]